MAVSPQVQARLQAQLKELTALKAELECLNTELRAGPAPELVELRDELERLKQEQAELTEQESTLPPQYRTPSPYKPAFGERHLFANQPLFNPPTEQEAEQGRIRWLPPEEHICHPLPYDLPNSCERGLRVIAKVTCSWGKPKT
jgi:hypothetical protein